MTIIGCLVDKHAGEQMIMFRINIINYIMKIVKIINEYDSRIREKLPILKCKVAIYMKINLVLFRWKKNENP